MQVVAQLGVSAHSLPMWGKAAMLTSDEKQSVELVETRIENLWLFSQMCRLEEALE